MTEELALVYLEPDDEVTSVVRRIRASDAARVVLVAPGRSRATASAVALRLLARTGSESGRAVSVVGDALTRSLAAEAGLEAWATVDEARAGAPAPRESSVPRAPIHVVRGDAGDETTGVVAPAVPPSAGAADETRAVSVRRQPMAPPTARPLAAPARAHVAVPPLIVLLGLMVLVLGAGAVAAAVLPAATVSVTPSAVPVGPLTYELRIDDAERRSGQVEATETVVATGTYAILEAATGVVAFRNFNTGDVAVAAGTLVAAGEQAFETTADIVVPAGTLTAEGTIRAGEEAVGVVAAAPGPAGNVAAGAIDTVLSQGTAARLRGFPNNGARLVVNPEATAGGIDGTGPEITPDDVEQARAALEETLRAGVFEALADDGDTIVADAEESTVPEIDGLDGLAGTRDEDGVQISGSLAYDRLAADLEAVVARAEEMLVGDATALPAGHELLPSSIRVAVASARADGSTLEVTVEVSASSSPTLDRTAIVDRIRGLPLDEARAAIAPLGDVRIELWPGWVDTVPELDWRVDVTLDGVRPSASPEPS
ncbi:MAG: baseplate J/gp47 family protein [Chloroflexi bacterium]|nr:baseplate J/gp47 family protein [Chloroflexota bacterium]